MTERNLNVIIKPNDLEEYQKIKAYLNAHRIHTIEPGDPEYFMESREMLRSSELKHNQQVIDNIKLMMISLISSMKEEYLENMNAFKFSYTVIHQDNEDTTPDMEAPSTEGLSLEMIDTNEEIDDYLVDYKDFVSDVFSDGEASIDTLRDGVYEASSEKIIKIF